MTDQKKVKSKNHHRSARHLARVFVLLGLYQWMTDPTKDYAGIEAHLEGLLHDEGEPLEGSGILPSDFPNADHALFARLLAGVLDRNEEVSEIVSRYIDRDLSRVSFVERAILFLGTFELLACPETPWRVILNESVELAKEFGSGYRFTNAVLEKVAREVRPEETAQSKK